MFAKAVDVRKELIVQKMSQSWHLERVKNAATFRASHFFCPAFSDATAFWPFQTALRSAYCPHATFASVPCSLLHQPELHHCVTSLHLDWSHVLVRCSAAGLGQLHRSDANDRFFTSPSSLSSIITLCSSSVLRSRLRHVWGGLVQSQLLHHSQVLHHLHPHLLLFHSRDDHALLLRLHHKNGEEHQRHVSWRLSHPTPEEGGERRHQGGFQFYISVLKSCTSILPTPVPYHFPLILA